MPVCKKCGSAFPNRLEIDGTTRNLGNRKYCIKCSPFNQHNTKDIVKYPRGNIIGEFKTCNRCGDLLPLSDFSRADKNNSLRGVCRNCYNKEAQERSKSLRITVMEKLGGVRCADCGCDVYDILEINHINGGGGKERKILKLKTLYKRILENEVDLKDYNVLCRVCNMKHYVEKIMGIVGYEIIWENN